MAASTARHETRALLRAHLAAASGYRHLTRRCPVCHRLLRLAMDPSEAVPEEPGPPPSALLGGRQAPAPSPAVVRPESPRNAVRPVGPAGPAEAAGTAGAERGSGSGSGPGSGSDSGSDSRDEGPTRA
ncbi:DUF6274 family protein [Streptomyces marianii]|uniref:Uncharacterized protein n=1 Tax=Streptomyces marianii TaxID=1817406 RepID=A0A5R9E6W3_9ACTN|nr:DUF6274 family protein [Streptomyces marianii]TLQ45027.1 hypothetical protein FEF34_19965 [Streptomyces marianii]